MASPFPYFPSPDSRDLESLRGSSIWAIVLGCVLIVGGIVALSYPVAATELTMTFFGVVLLIGGVVQGAGAVWARSWGGFFLHLVIGLLYLFVGLVLVDRPLLSAVEWTLLLAIFFVAAGVFRMVAALALRFSGWGWALLNGAIAFVLGLLVWRNWPGAGLWVVGLFVGIDLLFSGWSWVMLGLAVRSIARPPTV
jgi:uncharacterized membrane protein HdeD (DUF308 family)